MALSGSFANHMLPYIRDVVGLGFKSVEAYYSKFFNVQTTDKQYEDFLHAAPMPLAVSRNEGGPTPFFDPLEGATKRFTPAQWSIGFQVSKEAWDDDQRKTKGAIRHASNNLMRSMVERVEVEAAKCFNNGFLAASAGGYAPITDNQTTGKLFDTAHVRLDGGTAQSNTASVSTALTPTSFRTGLIQFERWLNDRGLKVRSTPVRLIYPPELQYDAMEILDSPMRPDAAENIKNVTMGEVAKQKYLYLTTGSTAWFLQAADHPLIFLWRERPSMDAYDDKNTRTSKFASFMRFTFGPLHWIGIYGNQGA